MVSYSLISFPGHQETFGVMNMVKNKETGKNHQQMNKCCVTNGHLLRRKSPGMGRSRPLLEVGGMARIIPHPYIK